jgi:hypothetical protein
MFMSLRVLHAAARNLDPHATLHDADDDMESLVVLPYIAFAKMTDGATSNAEYAVEQPVLLQSRATLVIMAMPLSSPLQGLISNIPYELYTHATAMVNTTIGAKRMVLIL